MSKSSIFALSLVAVLACASTVPLLTTPSSTAPAFCFEGKVRFQGASRAAQGCFETDALCRKALGTARNYGSMAGVEKLSNCEIRGTK